MLKELFGVATEVRPDVPVQQQEAILESQAKRDAAQKEMDRLQKKVLAYRDVTDPHRCINLSRYVSDLEVLQAKPHLPETERELALMTMQHTELSQAHDQLLNRYREAIRAHYRAKLQAEIRELDKLLQMAADQNRTIGLLRENIDALCDAAATSRKDVLRPVQGNAGSIC